MPAEFKSLELSPNGHIAIQRAKEEGLRLNHSFIGTEHLLLGVLAAGEAGSCMLESFGVKLERARRQVEFVMGRGDGRWVKGPSLEFTPRAAKVIKVAMTEEQQAQGRTPDNPLLVSDLDIIAGIIVEGEGIGYGVLESMGVNVDDLASEIKYVRPVYRLLEKFNQIADSNSNKGLYKRSILSIIKPSHAQLAKSPVY